MRRAKEYMERLYHDENKLREAENIICGFLDDFETKSKEDLKQTMLKIHELAYGPHFDEATAKEAVVKMENVDGTDGEHWTYEQICQLANSKGISYPEDLYYAMNMLYSDLYRVIGNDTEKYLVIAKALYWDDPDMEEGKLFKQYVAVN